MIEQQKKSVLWMAGQAQALQHRTAAVMALLEAADLGEEIDLLDFELKRADLAALVNTMYREVRAIQR